MTEDKRDPQTYAIPGAAIEVHRTLGCGFLEVVYQQALTIEFEHKAIVFLREAPLTISYKGQILPSAYRADFLCFQSVIVELKALARLSGTEEAQTIIYMRASGIKLGLLLNFGATRLEYKRLILSESHLSLSASSAEKILR